MQTYWDGLATRRISRRRALTTAAGVGASALFLAACGGSSSENKPVKNVSGLVADLVDTTSKAMRGGVLKDSVPSDAKFFEPHIRDFSVAALTPRVYQRLVRDKPSSLKPFVWGDVESDAAESWEYSADKLTLTFKLRGNNKWDQRAPTNGRVLDANDVVFTWKRYLEVSTQRGELATSVNPAAPVLSMTAPDASTVVLKLSSPNADLLQTLALTSTGVFYIVPKEAEGGFDLRTDMRGSGMYYLSEYVPSSRFVMKRNPGYYDTKQPYFDEWNAAIIPEYAAGLSQFKAGTLYMYNVQQQDIVQLKKDVPQLVLAAGDMSGSPVQAFFGYQDVPTSIFRDERVRQAWSMSLQRDDFIDAFYNVSNFKSAGIDLPTGWSAPHSNLSAGWWIDPQSKDFGENGKNFKHDIAEAKKLLAAAGYSSGVESEAAYIQTPQYSQGGLNFPKQCEVMVNMAQEAGFKLKIVPVNYDTEWRPRYANALGKFTGISFIHGGAEAAGYRSALFSNYNAKGALFKGFAADGSTKANGDPYLEDATSKLAQEFDKDKAIALAHEIQKFLGKKLYNMLAPGGASSLSLGWPAVGNFGVYRQDNVRRYLWFDSGQPPAKA